MTGLARDIGRSAYEIKFPYLGEIVVDFQGGREGGEKEIKGV